MHDLTQGTIPKHLISMALPMMIGMLIQTLYFIVDLYFVGKLGPAALAGLSLAGNAMFLIFALTQILNVSTAALISHAVGAKNQNDANITFNQSMMVSTVVGVVVCIAGYLGAQPYLDLISKDAETVKMGLAYLHWFIPCMALQFIMVSISSALRGTGIVKPTMVIQTLSILLNIILSPILIAGWGSNHAMGISGAGLASSISIIFAVALLCYYFKTTDKYISVDFSLWGINLTRIKKLLAIGLPAGGEFFLMFVYMGAIYWLIKPFGAEAQAAFGLGSRVMQALFLPAMAIAFAAPAIAGQNFGAQNYQRVKETFRWTALMTCSLMAIISLICLTQAELMLSNFSDDQEVILISVAFLQMICWNFVPAGLVFTCSGMFQALGNTMPALLSTATRLITFILPALWLSKQDNFLIEQLWYISVATVCLQALVSYHFLQREFKKRLPADNLSTKCSDELINNKFHS
ncbi:MATE family efflux transporter [Colwellia psychrerythraea]|uniref:Multidrug-efflux transporter n=1 Tax=Colwellia psychrerythraea TaxID=28229 RepID=A0A099KM05_COLPS|nr:MATE family efflux transporter [Colwellia psychrerythraea]KGJ91496.1 MATE efflux family protein [Colwellia psychrerythraea]